MASACPAISRQSGKAVRNLVTTRRLSRGTARFILVMNNVLVNLLRSHTDAVALAITSMTQTHLIYALFEVPGLEPRGQEGVGGRGRVQIQCGREKDFSQPRESNASSSFSRIRHGKHTFSPFGDRYELLSDETCWEQPPPLDVERANKVTEHSHRNL